MAKSCNAPDDGGPGGVFKGPPPGVEDGEGVVYPVKGDAAPADAAGLTVKLVDKNTDPLVELAQWDVSLPTE